MSNILLPDRVYYITSASGADKYPFMIRTQKITNTKMIECFVISVKYFNYDIAVFTIPPDYYLNPNADFNYSVVDITGNHLFKLLSRNYE